MFENESFSNFFYKMSDENLKITTLSDQFKQLILMALPVTCAQGVRPLILPLSYFEIGKTKYRGGGVDHKNDRNRCQTSKLNFQLTKSIISYIMLSN